MPGFELVGPEEQAAVNEVFEKAGGVLFRHGFDVLRHGSFKVVEFERRFADAVGMRYAQAVTSGTAAVKVALKALGVRPGDEVITQCFTFVATAEAILELGATPVFTQIDAILNMDPEDLERRITPRTKAIVPVHMLGSAAPGTEKGYYARTSKSVGVYEVSDFDYQSITVKPDDMKQKYEGQRDKEFAAHVCVKHPRATRPRTE